MHVVNARVRTLRNRSCVAALLLLGVGAAMPAAWASDDDPLAKLGGELEGILDAELEACNEIKQMTLDDLARARMLATAVVSPSEKDLVDYDKAQRALREAQTHLKAVEDQLAERLSKVRLQARSAIEYEQGKVDELLKKAQPLDEAIRTLEGQIASLSATIAAELAKIAKMSWVEQQTAKQPADEQARVKALTDEVNAKKTELQPIAAELAPHQQSLADLKAKQQTAEQKAEAEFVARLTGARAEVARLKKPFDILAARLKDAQAGAVNNQLQRPGILQCIADREDELLREGIGTGGTGTTDDAITAGGDGETVPPHAPGSQPFSSAGIEGKVWPGTWEVTCDQGEKQERKNGVGEFRFAGNKASMLLKQLFVEDPAQAESEKPIDIPLDELGAFAFHTKDEMIEFGLSGQFQVAAGADGAPRPTGAGRHQLSMDLSFLAGMVGSVFTMGGGAGEELTPEQKEEYIQRCHGTWDLPAG
jgi:uncharacterized protein YoxC